MKIAIGSDHRGFELKEKLKEILMKSGNDVLDHGPDCEDPVDYPVYAKKVADSVSSKEADKGILICGSGIGVSIAANKIKGIRAALARSEYEAKMAVKHDDANILCIGADITSEEESEKMTEIFLSEEFEGGRHERRINLISEMENK